MPIQVTVEQRRGGPLSWLSRGWEGLFCDYLVTGYTKRHLRLQCGVTVEFFDRRTGYKVGDSTLRIALDDMPRIEAAIKAKEALHG